MCKSPNMLCGEIRQYSPGPTNGDVYVFIESSRHILKLLVWENGGYAIHYKRDWMPEVAYRQRVIVVLQRFTTLYSPKKIA